MKKYLLSALFALSCIFASLPASAVEDPYPSGTLLVGAQIGPDFVVGINSGFTLGIAPALIADYVLADSWWIGHFTVGGAVGCTYVGGIDMSTGVETRANFFVAPRVTYGINLGDGLEVHAGLTAGPYLHYDQVILTSGDKKYDHPSSLKFDPGFILGARYFFNDRFGVSAEFNSADFKPILGAGLVYLFDNSKGKTAQKSHKK